MRTRLLKKEASDDDQPERLRATGVIGSRGTFVIPAALRRKLGLTEGQHVVAEEYEDGLLIRRAAKPALDEARRRHILEETTRDYAALADDADVWEEVLAERKELEGTLMDGLDPDEVWTEDGDVVRRSERAGG